ncbi:RNA 2',3'-cyclic phosphodiesterase [Patescibacteria group bacterium]
MKRHRIFISINLPENIKKRLVGHQSKWPELPIKWTKKENLHITLIFLGHLSSDELVEICKITKEVASRSQSFFVNLNKINYGPPRKMPPRMIWAIGEKSKEFTLLRDDLEKSIIGSEKVNFSSENRIFSPHITLGRIKTWEFKQIEPEDRPQFVGGISFGFDVNSIEVMESQLKRGGPEYTILESAELQG